MTDDFRARAHTRALFYRALREYFAGIGYLEVETPCLVPAPGMEPHITPFQSSFVPDLGGSAGRAWLHTSPEYAMKRLLAQPDCPPIFQICKAFRNGEVARWHNPEFSMLEFYKPQATYVDLMEILEAALAYAEASVAPERNLFARIPYERITVSSAFLRHTGLDPLTIPDGVAFAELARRIGVRISEDATFDQVFFQVFLERVEPTLGVERPCFLFDYPASMASLARLAPENSMLAERVELFAAGLELANGFSELTDENEQRARLEAEQQARKEWLPIDEDFLSAVGAMPPSAGIAVGLDRVLALMLEKSTIADTLLFPWASV